MDNIFLQKNLNLSQNYTKIYENLKYQFIKIDSKIMREKNFKNAYCYIYSFLLKKDTIIFENE